MSFQKYKYRYIDGLAQRSNFRILKKMYFYKISIQRKTLVFKGYQTLHMKESIVNKVSNKGKWSGLL